MFAEIKQRFLAAVLQWCGSPEYGALSFHRVPFTPRYSSAEQTESGQTDSTRRSCRRYSFGLHVKHERVAVWAYVIRAREREEGREKGRSGNLMRKRKAALQFRSRIVLSSDDTVRSDFLRAHAIYRYNIICKYRRMYSLYLYNYRFIFYEQ